MRLPNEGEKFEAKGYEFTFVHPVSETCRNGKSGLTYGRNTKIVRIPILDKFKALEEAEKQPPKCDNCGNNYEFYSHSGRFGEYVDATA